MTRVHIGSDHAAFAEKEVVKAHLAAKGMEVHDHGCDSTASVDYPDYAGAVAKAVAASECERGILLCGTGIGVSIAANKVRGIRAALCHTPFEATMARQHNDANVLCAGARVLDQAVILQLVDTFLATAFEGGRHGRRVDKMMALEHHSS